LEPKEQAFATAVLGKRCLRILTFQATRGGDDASPHFSLFFELEGGDSVRAIFDLDTFFWGAGATSLPQRPDRYRLSEAEPLRPFFGRLIDRVEFHVDSSGLKKLHVHFDSRDAFAYWNEELSSRLAVSGE
jgi:hypothetical protein